MLVELAARDLGVIAEVRLVFGPGMTALTGETGAGKTLLIDAIALLVGGRAEPMLVRPGASEAVVEGRFIVPPPAGVGHEDDRDNGTEVVLTRVVPSTGRSRAYVDGRLATATELAEWGRRLVDLHGQHAHQSLLGAAVQRDVLDRFAMVDFGELDAARQRLVELEAELAALGGDERARAREIDLYRFQVEELDAAAVQDVDEDVRLDAEEDLLADAVAHQHSALGALEALNADGGAMDGLGSALSHVADRAPFREHEDRLRAVISEVDDLAAGIRQTGEEIDPDPERLEAIRIRRQLLRELRRKYGETLGEVMDYATRARECLAELEGHDANAERLDRARGATMARLENAQRAVGEVRRAASPELARAIQDRLVELGMGRSVVEVSVGSVDPGDDIEIRLSTNRGAPPLPLARTASGGELARAMLAIRLVLTAGPPVLVFDEVDAGIGGDAAIAVGRALAKLSTDHQVLVVTHLPQVAAHADHQVSVTKRDQDGVTVSEASVLDRSGRVAELSRMLSGSASGEAARQHASELLDSASLGRAQ